MSRRITRKQLAFLEAYKQTVSITEAAKQAGVDRGAHYEWMRNVPEYPEKFREADEQATGSLEDEVSRRAYKGVQQAIFYEGKPIGSKRVYSDTLAMFLLKARRPDKYRERVTTEHTGPNGGPIELKNEALAALTDDQLADLIRIARLLAVPGGDGSGATPPSAQ